jgi:hypothetical protein
VEFFFRLVSSSRLFAGDGQLELMKKANVRVDKWSRFRWELKNIVNFECHPESISGFEIFHISFLHA